MGGFCILKKCGKKKEPAKPAAPPAPPPPPPPLPAGGNSAPPCCCCANGRNPDPLSRIRSVDYIQSKHYRLNHWDDNNDYYAPSPPPLSRSMSARLPPRVPGHALAPPPPHYSHYDMPQSMSYYEQPPSPRWRYVPPPQRHYGPQQYDYYEGRGAPAHDYYYDYYGGYY